MTYKLSVNGRHASSVDRARGYALMVGAARYARLSAAPKYGCRVRPVRAPAPLHLGGEATRSVPDTGFRRRVGNQTPSPRLEGLSAGGTPPGPARLGGNRRAAVPAIARLARSSSAAALLAKNPKPADKDIDSAMNGNLCRWRKPICGSARRASGGGIDGQAIPVKTRTRGNQE